MGATCPHNLEAVGVPPPNFELSMLFKICLPSFKVGT